MAVAVVDVDETAGRECERAYRGKGPVRFFAADVGSEPEVKAAVRAVK